MPPTSDLDMLGQLFESQFIHAWKLFRELKYDEANSLCRQLLAEPRVGHLHRAGLHVILAQSPHDYVHHANEAVRLYETLYANEELSEQPSERQRESQDELLGYAKAIQVKALADEASLAKSPPSDTEVKEWVQQQIDDLDSQAEEVEKEMEAERDMESEESANEGTSNMVRGRQAGSDEEDNVSMLTPLREDSDEDAEEVAGEDIVKATTPKAMSATDKRTIAEGMLFSGSTGLATPGVSRTTSGQSGPGRRSSRLH